MRAKLIAVVIACAFVFAPAASAQFTPTIERGFWGPRLTGELGGGGQIYTVNHGEWMRVGRMHVTASFDIQLAAKGVMNGNVVVFPLPFQVYDSRRSGSLLPGGGAGVVGEFANLLTPFAALSVMPVGGNYHARLTGTQGAAFSSINVPPSAIADNTRLVGSVTYISIDSPW